MPKTVDHQQKRQEILLAFQSCVLETPLAQVSLRGVAKKAGLSHQIISYYFGSKKDLILCYIQYVSDLYVEFYRSWNDFIPTADCDLSRFVEERMLSQMSGDTRTHSAVFIQICAMGLYDQEIGQMVRETYASFRKTLSESLHNFCTPEQVSRLSDGIISFMEGLQFYHMSAQLPDDRIRPALTILKQALQHAAPEDR